jgi:hypothetical protein
MGSLGVLMKTDEVDPVQRENRVRYRCVIMHVLASFVPPIQGLKLRCDTPPRALPWAIELHPLGVSDGPN